MIAVDVVDRFASLRDVAETTKRASRPAGFEAWFRYYAGFSESWAASALKSQGLPTGAVVVDPWNGSGTTTRIASQLGFRASGIDINPVASLVASAKLAHGPDATHFEGILAQIFRNASSSDTEADPNDPLRRWLSKDLVSLFRRLVTATLKLLATKADHSTVNPLAETPPPLASFFLLCLMRAARQVARFKEASNPTWHAPSYISRAATSTLLNHTREFARVFALALTSTSEQNCPTILLGDARKLPIGDASVDLVLTSPPYCTRLDYVVSASFELAALSASDQDLLSLRRASMGTPLMRHDPTTTKHLGSVTHRLLQQIKNHSSKNSETYYHPSYVQYFNDAYVALKEIKRTLRPGGRAILVLQSSFYKEIPIDLSRHYLSMSKELGMYGERVVRQPVSKVLTDINPAARKHLSSRSYYEDVVGLEVI